MNALLEQAAFDIDAMLAEVNPLPPRPEYAGIAPVHFTAAYFTMEELVEAFQEWCERNGSFGSHPRSHMWVGAAILPASLGHTLTTMRADLRCTYDADHRAGCMCVGSLTSRAQCDACRWVAIGRESDTITAWHDHAWPGWRDLPVVPESVRPSVGGISKTTKAAYAWCVAHYPTDWQVDGAPVLTERSDSGTRAVPGRSPWGGYDISSADVERAA